MDKPATFTRIFVLLCILFCLLLSSFAWASLTQGNYAVMLYILPCFTLFIASAFMNYYLGKRGHPEASSGSPFASFKMASTYLKETKDSKLRYIYYLFIVSFLYLASLIIYDFIIR